MKKRLKAITELSNSLMFSLNEDELNSIVSEFEEIHNKLSLLKNIDVSGIKHTNFLFHDENIFLRDDIIDETNNIDNSSILSDNANFDGEYLVIKDEK